MLVYTTKGLVERSRLAVQDLIDEQETCRVIATEWRLDGEIVRRDVNVNMLRGLEMGAEQARVG